MLLLLSHFYTIVNWVSLGTHSFILYIYIKSATDVTGHVFAAAVIFSLISIDRQ